MRSCGSKQGPQGMTVFEVNALLYKPGHPADRLEKALHIPALSTGWRTSFKQLLEGALAPTPPAWAGFSLAAGYRQKARERQRDVPAA